MSPPSFNPFVFRNGKHAHTVEELVQEKYQVIVVDDGSTDQTLTELQGLPIHLLHHRVWHRRAAVTAEDAGPR